MAGIPAVPSNQGMNKLDSALLNLLIKDGRASFADIARQLGVCLSSVEKYMASALRHCVAFQAVLADER